MAVALKQGVWSTTIGLAGGGAVVIAPTQLWIGYSLFAAAFGIFLWGIEINGLHIWQLFRSPSRPWYEGRTRLTVREAASLAAGVAPRDFDRSDKAQSIASDLRHALIRGNLLINGAPPADQAVRRFARSVSGFTLNEVTLDSTFVSRSTLDVWIEKRQSKS